MKKIFVTLVKLMAVFVLVLACYSSIWGWRVAKSQIDDGSYCGETYTNLEEIGLRSTLRLEAYNDDDNKITGIKYSIKRTKDGGIIFGVNMQEHWTNIIIGDKIFNFHNN